MLNIPMNLTEYANIFRNSGNHKILELEDTLEI